MPNNYYERQSEMNPGELADGLAMEQEFDAIGRGFSKLPAPHRDGRGFEGPTRVGDPVDESDAVNLGSIEKFNIPIYRKKITIENWNDITTAGIYDVVGATGTNKPPIYSYGVLNVYSFNGVVTQIYYPDVNDDGLLAKRSCQNIAANTWTDWAVLALASRKSTCLVAAIGTGAPHETVSAALPATVASNSTYNLENPFGVNVPWVGKVQLKTTGDWFDAGWDGNAGSSGAGSYGARVVKSGNYVQIKTGTFGVDANASIIGSGGPLSGGSTATAQCRVFIIRIDD